MKIIEIIADSAHHDTIAGIATQHKAVDFWFGPVNDDQRQSARVLADSPNVQPILDALQSQLGGAPNYRIVIIQPEAILPRAVKDKPADEQEARRGLTTSREELFDNVEKGSRLDSNFLILVFFSTIVAAIGLIEDNVAVIIGAMVIAPLLGPNLALALGTALGDKELVRKSLVSNVAGIAFAMLLSVIIAQLLPINLESKELIARTTVGLDSVTLALASGAAAVLSLTTGLSSVLVGVMVAVALLPPTATLGLMLGLGQWQFAVGAALLLAVNIVCVNLSAKLVLLFRGVRPRTWLEKRKAAQSMLLYIIFWAGSLGLLILAIVVRR